MWQTSTNWRGEHGEAWDKQQNRKNQRRCCCLYLYMHISSSLYLFAPFISLQIHTINAHPFYTHTKTHNYMSKKWYKKAQIAHKNMMHTHMYRYFYIYKEDWHRKRGENSLVEMELFLDWNRQRERPRGRSVCVYIYIQTLCVWHILYWDMLKSQASVSFGKNSSIFSYFYIIF